MILGGRFGYFYFFLFWAGGKEEASEEVAGGGSVLIKIEGGGGVSEEEAREGEWRRGNFCGEGGGAKYFFSGPKRPPRIAYEAITFEAFKYIVIAISRPQML